MTFGNLEIFFFFNEKMMMMVPLSFYFLFLKMNEVWSNAPSLGHEFMILKNVNLIIFFFNSDAGDDFFFFFFLKIDK